MASDIELLKRVYAMFNAREMDAVLAAMHPEVVWANGMEGGYVQGRDGVRAYWTRQWAVIDPHVDPVSFAEGQAGTIEVEVHQVVKDLEGKVLLDRMVRHGFCVEEGLVRRFDIRS
jgi:hypothetical protein